MVNPEEPHNKPQSLEARIICVMAVAPEVRAYEDQFDLSGPTIEFVVGPDLTPVTFHIHEKLVCASSDFCKCAVNGPWKESKSRSIVLDDVTRPSSKSMSLGCTEHSFQCGLTRQDTKGTLSISH